MSTPSENIMQLSNYCEEQKEQYNLLNQAAAFAATYECVPKEHEDYNKLSTTRDRQGRPVWGMHHWYESKITNNQ